MCTWADRYPFQAEIKTDSTGLIRPEIIVVTSNYSPEEIWGHDPAMVATIKRRFKVVEIVKLGDSPVVLPKMDQPAKDLCRTCYFFPCQCKPAITAPPLSIFPWRLGISKDAQEISDEALLGSCTATKACDYCQESICVCIECPFCKGTPYVPFAISRADFSGCRNPMCRYFWQG